MRKFVSACALSWNSSIVWAEEFNEAMVLHAKGSMQDRVGVSAIEAGTSTTPMCVGWLNGPCVAKPTNAAIAVPSRLLDDQIAWRIEPHPTGTTTDRSRRHAVRAHRTYRLGPVRRLGSLTVSIDHCC